MEVWISNSDDWFDKLKTQTITGTKNFTKTIGCKTFSLKAKAMRKIIVIVNPKPTKMSMAKRISNAKAVIKWDKGSNIDGYEIQLSRNTSFTSSRTISVSERNKSSFELKNLSAKKTYYVRVRTYKRAGGVIYKST